MARALAEQLLLSEPVGAALAAAYERWDGRGWPGELGGEDIPVPACIAQVAEFVEWPTRSAAPPQRARWPANDAEATSIPPWPTCSSRRPT